MQHRRPPQAPGSGPFEQIEDQRLTLQPMDDGMKLFSDDGDDQTNGNNLNLSQGGVRSRKDRRRRSRGNSISGKSRPAQNVSTDQLN